MTVHGVCVDYTTTGVERAFAETMKRQHAFISISAGMTSLPPQCHNVMAIYPSQVALVSQPCSQGIPSEVYVIYKGTKG